MFLGQISGENIFPHTYFYLNLVFDNTLMEKKGCKYKVIDIRLILLEDRNRIDLTFSFYIVFNYYK